MTGSKTVIRPDGVELSCDLRGSGIPVVQLHGLTSSRRRDEMLGLDLTAGQEGLRVTRYDARGHGLSTGRPDPEDYRWPVLARDLLAVLDATCPDEPVHGVGQSMGAATLLTAAVAEPRRFASLTLCIPPTAWSSRPAQAERYEASAQLVEAEGVEAFVAASRALPLPPAVDPNRPETLPDVRAELLPVVFRGAARTDLPEPGEVATLRVPTTVLCWPADPGHPVEVARGLVELLDGAELHQASTPVEVAGWPRRIAGFVRGCSG